ncbi:dnaJ homolog subfamily C member 22 isoform X4 [Chanodichthys erythropterus]|uniref:dnaJ homolog subfamily C member 22 isoform X4 n=1 Tax=Chanodichthys erythropterus TaxID=933992 RepID=UPI00351E7710
MAKKLLITYALWAMGGPLGLHHIYLGRDSHALLWILTFGGFGIGWAREFFRIPSYVSEANHEAERAQVRHPRATPPPPVGLIRFAGQICVGIYFGSVALISLSSLSFFYFLVLPLSVGAGVHLVSSVGQQTSDLQKTLITCIITSSIFYGSNLSPLPISIAASVTAAQHNTFKPLRPEPLGGGFYEESWRKMLEIILNEYSKKEMEALKILSLPEEASLEEVTRSYRELAKVWHPDHNPKRQAEAQQMFIQIQEAYEILLDRHKTRRKK